MPAVDYKKSPTDLIFYMRNISHRAAVRVLRELAEEVLSYGACEFFEGWCGDKAFDQSLEQLTEKIRGLKKDAEKWRKLKKLLED